jgi:hypothetical protein
MLVLLLVPLILLGVCAVAATLVGGRADRYMEAQRESRLYHLPRADAEERAADPPMQASG